MNFFEALLIPPGSVENSLEGRLFEVTRKLKEAAELLSTQNAELATAKAEIEQLRKEKKAGPNVTVEEDVSQKEHENETKLLKALLVFVSMPTSAFKKDEFIQFDASWIDFMFHCINDKKMKNTNRELTKLLEEAVKDYGVGRPDWLSIKDMLVSKTGDVRMILRLNNKGDMVTKYADSTSAAKGNMLFVPKKDMIDVRDNKHNWYGFKIVQPDEKDKAARQTTMLAKIPHWNQHEHKVTLSDNADEFSFERILTDQTQGDVFTEVEPFIFSAMQGKDVGLFAYGGTGTGKTYTMGTEAGVNDDDKKGIMPRILETLLNNQEIRTASLQVIEIIPGISGKEINPLFRVLDLIDLTDGHNDPTNADEFVGMFDKKRNPRGQSYFYTPNPKISRAPKASFKMDQCTFKLADSGNKTRNFYNSGNQTKDCNEDIKQVSVPQVFQSYVFKNKTLKLSSTDILTQYNTYIDNRRAVITGGNAGTANMDVGGSSRTHLLTIIEITMGETSSKIFVVDLAGKEEDPENASPESLALTKGINRTLTSLTNLIGQKNAFLPNTGPNADSGFLGPINKWDDGKYVGYENPPKNDPLMILTAPLWEKVDSKIMMIVCAYPLSSQSQIPFSFKEYMEQGIDGWKTFLGFKEDGFKKFKRDFAILESFSKIQKKQVKSIR